MENDARPVKPCGECEKKDSCRACFGCSRFLEYIRKKDDWDALQRVKRQIHIKPQEWTRAELESMAALAPWKKERKESDED